jgi:hypothetical protein
MRTSSRRGEPALLQALLATLEIAMFGEERLQKFVSEFVHYLDFQDTEEEDAETKRVGAQHDRSRLDRNLRPMGSDVCSIESSSEPRQAEKDEGSEEAVQIKPIEIKPIETN